MYVYVTYFVFATGGKHSKKNYPKIQAKSIVNKLLDLFHIIEYIYYLE